MWNALYTEKYSLKFLQKIQSQIFAKFARNKKGWFYFIWRILLNKKVI